MKLSTANIILIVVLFPLFGYSMNKEEIFEVVALPTTIHCFRVNPNMPLPANHNGLANYFQTQKTLAPTNIFSNSLQPSEIKIASPETWDHNYIPEWKKIVEARRQAIVSKCKIEVNIESEEYKEYFETEQLKEQMIQLSLELQRVTLQNQDKKKEYDTLTQKIIDLETRNNCSKKNMPTQEKDITKKRTRISRVKNKRKIIQSTPEIILESDITTRETTSPSIHPTQTKPLPIKMRKWIYERCNVKNKYELVKDLQDLAYDHCMYQYTTDEQALVQWKKEKHLLIKKINQYLLCYCPCTQAVLINTGSYSTLLETLPQDFLCTKPCNNSTLAMKELMANLKAYDTTTIHTCLKSLVRNLYTNPKHTIINAHFDPKNHVLMGKINNHWLYVFCPCKESIGYIHDHTYPCCFDTIKEEKLLPKSFLCNNTCKYYSPKSGAFDEEGSEHILTKRDIENV